MTRLLKVLFDKINNLGPTEHLEIFKILQDQGIAFTENNNGVFFNLTSLPKEVHEKVDEFVEYCCDNKKELDEYDLKLQECKYNNQNKSRLMMPNCIRDPNPKKENIKEMFESVDKGEAIQEFVQKLYSAHDKIISKRVNSKYAIAKKRFAKRVIETNEVFQDELVVDAI